MTGSKVPSRSRGTSISTWPVASVRTVFGLVPLRTFEEPRSGSAWCFSCPRCSVISSFSAVSRTVFVNCFNSPSGPVSDRPCSAARRTSSFAASSSAEGSGLFFFTASSVVITAPSPPDSRPTCQAGNTKFETVPDPVCWENRLANAILDNPAIALDIEATRHPRPAIPTPPGMRASEWKDLSAKLANEETSTFDSVFRSDRAGIVIGTVSQDPRSCAEVLGGRYSSWKIIGSEEQRRIGRVGRNERGLLVQRYFGLEYRTSNDADGLDAPPLANANSAMWKLPLPESQIAGPIIGTQPFMGYDDRMELHDDSKDGLGIPHRLMVPTGWLREKWNLRTDPDRAFVLNDDAGPALALLTWRAEYERSDYHLPRRKLWGSAIAVRPDLLENLIGECGDELKLRDLIVGPAEILL